MDTIYVYLLRRNLIVAKSIVKILPGVFFLALLGATLNVSLASAESMQKVVEAQIGDAANSNIPVYKPGQKISFYFLCDNLMN